MTKVNRGKSISPALKYLRKQVREEIKDIDRRLATKTTKPISHALKMDECRFFQRRIDVAVLIEKDFISQTRDDLLRELLEEIPKPMVIGGDEGTYTKNVKAMGFNDYHDQVETLLERKLSTVKK